MSTGRETSISPARSAVEPRPAEARRALGIALGCRAEECAHTVDERMARAKWLGKQPSDAYLRRRSEVTWFATMLVARWLASNIVPEDAEMAWGSLRGRVAAEEGLSIINVARGYLVWRDVACEILENEAAAQNTPRAVLDDALKSVRTSCDAGLMRMNAEFDRQLRAVSDERQMFEDQLRHLAFHDVLTGLANRALFTDRLEHAIARQGRIHETSAVMIIDVDDFKAINDSLGHSTGDSLIVEIAQRIRASVRSADTVARLGGDEFAVLLENVAGMNAVLDTCKRIFDALATPFHLADRTVPVTASLGIALATPETEQADDVVRNADVAMYVAKARGKAGYAVFEPGMQLAIHDRMQLKTDLVEALRSGSEMELYYQPVVDLVSHRMIGVEALLRWRHPLRGVLPPLDFIPLAEETGLIVPLGRWVLQRSCHQLQAWEHRYPAARELTLSVNVSARQLVDSSLVDDVRSSLCAAQLSPDRLIIEITESMLVRDSEQTLHVLNQLKDLGVGIAVDDFGTGYSSLGFLQRFPLDILKVDRTFTSSLDDPQRARLAQAVVRIGQSLNLRTVAEGIEEQAQAEQLRDLSCELGQGYFFARPMATDALEDLLREEPPPLPR